MTTQTLEQVQERIRGLPSSQQRAVVCALVGHSRIQTQFWGYYYCARCEEQVGDALGSSYPEAANVVVVGHNCETCRANRDKLSWRDTFMAPEPFQVTEAAKV